MPEQLVPSTAEILHESTGLTIHRNAKNRFVVASLYYFADPSKRKAEWSDTVKAGMTPSQWEKEYEISYTAQFGERVFPQIIDKKEVIVVPDFDIDGAQFWGGFDFGQRNPSSFHVYTHYDGAFYAIWELYKPCVSIPEFALELKQCPYYHNLKYIAADPSLFAPRRTHNAAGEAASINSLFIKEGITKFIAGSTDEAAWLASLRKHWEGDDPTFKIFESCHYMVKEFGEATFEDYSNDRMQEVKNYKEGIQNKNNHSLDDNKYFFNSQPIAKGTHVKKDLTAIASKWYGWGEKGRKRNMVEGTPSAFGHGARHPRYKEFI